MTPLSWRTCGLGLAVAGWGAAVFTAYYLVHPPLFLLTKISAFTSGGESADSLKAIPQLTLMLAGWIGTLVLAHTLGRWGAPFLSEMAARERLALRIGLGFGALGLVVLIGGFLHLYYSALAWLSMAAIFPFGARPLMTDLRAALPRWPANNANRALATFIALTLSLIFLRALAPVTAWDSLVYHLTGPKLYLEAGRIHHDVDLMYLGFPQWGSMLFLWGMLIASPQLAQLIHFTFALLTLALVPGVTNRIAPGRGWLAAAICLSVPTAALLASWAYVEWMTMFCGLAAFVCFAAEIAEKEKSNSANSARSAVGPSLVAMAGVFTGLAFAAKYTAVGLCLGLGLLALARSRSHRQRIAFALAAIIAAAPYLIKNAALTGNPIYPFFFAGKYWDADRSFWYGQPGTGLNWIQLLAAPWDATVWGLEGAIVRGHPPYSASVGPLLLMLVPISILRVGRTLQSAVLGRLESLPLPTLVGIFIVSAVGYIVWTAQLALSVLLVQTRLLFPLLPFFAIMAAVGFDALAKELAGAPAPKVIAALIALALTIAAADSVFSFANASPLAVIVRAQSESDYLADRLGLYQYAMQAVNELPPGSRIEFLWEARSFYCGPSVVCEPDAILDRWWHLRRSVGGAAAIARQWRAEGVTHVLIFWPKYQTGEHVLRAQVFDPFTDFDWTELDRLTQDYMTIVKDLNGVYVLYRLNDD